MPTCTHDFLNIIKSRKATAENSEDLIRTVNNSNVNTDMIKNNIDILSFGIVFNYFYS